MSRRVSTIFTPRLGALGVSALVLLLGACEQNPQAGVPAGVITLENQTEHSGILVALAEVDTFVVTDSLGFFSFGELPGGSYTLSARYPYFETVEAPLRVDGDTGPEAIHYQLRQVFQFWVEPLEMTISLMAATSEISGLGSTTMRATVVNLTDDAVTIGAPHGPFELVAVSPVDHSWPFVPNPDNRAELCYEHYEWLGSSTLTVPAGYNFGPEESLQSSIRVDLDRTCFEAGTYLVFFSVNDAAHYPEYFNAGHFWDQQDPQTWIFTPFNRTLLKKHNLFRPAVLHLTE